MINNIYVTNITRCFESIHVLGQYTLYKAMKFISSLRVSNMKRQFLNFEQLIWIKINDKGITLKAIWASLIPRHDNRLSLTITKFLMFHKCLTSNCFVHIGNRT